MRGVDDLERLLVAHRRLSLEPGDLAFARDAHRATRAGDADALLATARVDVAARLAAVRRRASLAQGRSLLRAVAAVALAPERAGIEWVAQALGELTPRCAVFGAVAAAVGVEEEDAAAALAYVTLAGMTAAAVRLGLAAPLQSHAALRRALAADAVGRDDEWAFFSPLLDIAAMQHELLEPRLFAS